MATERESATVDMLQPGCLNIFTQARFNIRKNKNIDVL